MLYPFDFFFFLWFFYMQLSILVFSGLGFDFDFMLLYNNFTGLKIRSCIVNQPNLSISMFLRKWEDFSALEGLLAERGDTVEDLSWKDNDSVRGIWDCETKICSWNASQKAYLTILWSFPISLGYQHYYLRKFNPSWGAEHHSLKKMCSY